MQTLNNNNGEPNCEAINEGFMKIPEPITPPITAPAPAPITVPFCVFVVLHDAARIKNKDNKRNTFFIII